MKGLGPSFRTLAGESGSPHLTGIGYLENDRFIPTAAPGGLVSSLTEDASGNL